MVFDWPKKDSLNDCTVDGNTAHRCGSCYLCSGDHWSVHHGSLNPWRNDPQAGKEPPVLCRMTLRPEETRQPCLEYGFC